MNPNIKKISCAEKISYGTLNFAHTLISMAVSTYILYYYTDVLLLPVASVSLLLLVIRLFDGAIDPFIGHYMDRRQSSCGNYKGYLIRFSAPFCILSVLLFAPVTDKWHKSLFYCYLVYFLWSLAYSMIEESSIALSMSMTKVKEQRQELNTYKIVFSIVATLTVTYALLKLVDYLGGGNEKEGFFLAFLIISVIGYLCMVPGLFLIKERHIKSSNRLDMVSNITIVLNNKRLICLLGMYFFHQIASNMKSQAVTYYFKYYFDRLDLVPSYMLLSRIGSLSAQPAIVYLSKKVKVVNLMIGGYLIAGFAMVLMVLSNTSPYLLIAINIVCSIGSAFPANLVFIYIAEIVDELSANNKNISFSAFTGSLLGLTSKVGVAVAGGSVALILYISAYTPNTDQGSSSMLGIRLCFIGVSALMYLLSGILAMLLEFNQSKLDKRS